MTTTNNQKTVRELLNQLLKSAGINTKNNKDDKTHEATANESNNKTNIRLCLFNDLHLEFGPFDFPNEDTYDAMIWAGDIYPINQWLENHIDDEALRNIPRNKPIYYVVGNHEYYHSKFDLEPLRKHLKKEFPNITLLEDDFVQLKEDVILYGMTMWTNFNEYNLKDMEYALNHMNDYHYIYTKKNGTPLAPVDTAATHDYSMDWANSHLRMNRRLFSADKKKDVDTRYIMVTHHSPLQTNNQNPRADVSLNPAYIAQDAKQLMNENDIVVWCHGHTHEVRDEMYKHTRILSNARGYIDYDSVRGFKTEGLIFEV